MSNASATIVQRLWNYCNGLRDDGVSYRDYVEQLTYLLFLKMDEEQQFVRPSSIPPDLRWSSLIQLDGDELERHYRHILSSLGAGAGLIPTIFRKAQNRIQDPAKLRRLVELINGETWMGLDIAVADSLAGDPGQRFDLVLTNPPFGKKSSISVVTGDGEAKRESPTCVLFEGGAGETVRRKLLHECDVHTLLRLPTGVFYAQGVKANVLFFDRQPAREQPWTDRLWIYDLRTNMEFTLKQNPLSRAALEQLEAIGDELAVETGRSKS